MPFTEGMVVLNKKLKSLKKTVISIRRSKSKNAKPDVQELQQSLDILSEKNLAITKQINEKELEIEKVKQKNLTLKEEYETKEVLFEKDKRFLCDQIKLITLEINEKQMEVENVKTENVSLIKQCKNKALLLKKERDFNNTLKEDKYKLEQEISKLIRDRETVHMSKVNTLIQEQNNGTLNNTLIEELKSLRIVLEIKQDEIKKLQVALAEAKQKEIELEVVMRKVHLLKTKCEDLQEQLKNKSESEQSLEEEISKLKRTILEENMQKRRLSYQNEELQWKLNRNIDTGSKKIKCSSQVSPSKIKKVVKKRASIGYVLDLDESPKKLKKLNR